MDSSRLYVAELGVLDRFAELSLLPITASEDAATPECEPRELDLAPDPTLSPYTQNLERIVLLLLQSPGFSLRHQNPYGVVRRMLELEPKSWDRAQAELRKVHLLKTRRSKPGAKKQSEITLDVDHLQTRLTRPKTSRAAYITPRVLRHLADRSARPDAPLPTAYKGMPDALQHAKDQEIVSLVGYLSLKVLAELEPVNKLVAEKPIVELRDLIDSTADLTSYKRVYSTLKKDGYI